MRRLLITVSSFGATLLMLLTIACGANIPTGILETPTATSTPRSPTEIPTATRPSVPTAVPETPTDTPTPRPPAETATATGPRVGDVAPDFTLADGNGNTVHLADEVKDHQLVVLVFYYAHT